jgi:hypothetical protein
MAVPTTSRERSLFIASLRPGDRRRGIRQRTSYNFSSMKHALGRCLALVLLMPAFAMAQNPVAIEVTAYAGVPIGSTLESNICCSTAMFVQHELDAAGYAGGLAAGVLLYDRVRIELGAVYMPVSFRIVRTECCPVSRPVSSRRGASWELPLLAAYRWRVGALRPFAGGGLVVHNTTSYGRSQAPAPAFNWGVEWGRSRFAIRPEFRFIHYPQSSSSAQDVGRPSFQAQFLFGFSFRN